MGPTGGLASGRKYLGQLPHDLAGYTDSAQVFYALVKDQGWLGFRASRKCVHDKNCETAAAGEMVIQAISDAHEVPRLIQQDIPAVVIGRVYNTGWYDDATLGIPGGTPSRPDHYYLVLVPGGASDNNLRVVHLRFKDNGSAMTLDVLPDKLMYASCGHQKPARKRGYAAFNNCTDGRPKPPKGAGETFVPGPGILADFTTAGMWMSCPDGCCSAGPLGKGWYHRPPDKRDQRT